MTKTATAVTPLGEVRVIRLNTITPYERNPRRIPAKAVEQTARSIRDFGWQQPLVVDPDLVLVAGHVRWAAAKSLGLESVPVVVAEQLSAAQARAYRIADNRSHDYTSWDFSQLVEELDGLGDEFAEVLDLTDWSALLAAFEAQGGGGTHRLPDSEEPFPGSGYVVTVEFASRYDADQAGPALLKVVGVINVRHPVGQNGHAGR